MSFSFSDNKKWYWDCILSWSLQLNFSLRLFMKTKQLWHLVFWVPLESYQWPYPFHSWNIDLCLLCRYLKSLLYHSVRKYALHYSLIVSEWLFIIVKPFNYHGFPRDWYFYFILTNKSSVFCFMQKCGSSKNLSSSSLNTLIHLAFIVVPSLIC